MFLFKLDLKCLTVSALACQEAVHEMILIVDESKLRTVQRAKSDSATPDLQRVP